MRIIIMIENVTYKRFVIVIIHLRRPRKTLELLALIGVL